MLRGRGREGRLAGSYRQDIQELFTVASRRTFLPATPGNLEQNDSRRDCSSDRGFAPAPGPGMLSVRLLFLADTKEAA
jgi:hypothetical protein